MNEQPPSRAHVGPAAGDTSPLVELDPLIRCGAGTSATFEVYITHRGPVAAYLSVTVLGLDGRWVPPPLPVGPIEPGETTRITLSLVPERGTLGAKYPFVVAAEATAVSGKAAPTMGVAESVLAVDGRDPITMTVSPQTPVAVFGRRIKVQITNPGHFDREISLTGSAARGAALALSSAMVLVPAGRTVTIPGRVRVTHPRIIGGQNTHTFAVAARGLGAPEFAEGTLRSKPLLGGRLTGLLIGVVVISLWAAAAVVGIPKLSHYFSNKSAADAAASAPVAPGAANATKSSGSGSSGAGAAGAGGSGAASSPGDGPGGSGPGGSGPGGAGTGAGAGEASGARLSGTVTGITPKGVSVSLEPTSLVEAAAAGAQPAAGMIDASTASALRGVSTGLYKVPGDALRLSPAASDFGIRSTSSAADGTFSFAGITAPGYYLLTLAKAGFATQRFMINASTLGSATPIKVALVPGDGAMSGTVTSPSGGVGAASVSITDGTVALQTSAASRTGVWTVKGLSTPGTYLVTVSSTGFGDSSKLVTLAAGGTGTADLALTPGVAAIDGTVSGTDGLGHLGGIGGVTVTATGTSKGVAATRTATTVTSGPVGTYALPDLPVPGQYTVTVSGTGYASQTQQVTLAVGSSAATVNISLTRADGTVAGTVSGGGNEGGVIGAGLTLTGANATYKTMTTSVPAGAYRFTGVPPGTYVLQGSLYGRVPSSATVVVTAAGTATANLTLISAPDTELPATSRITGRAVDSRTQGPLTCDRAADPRAVCVVTASVPIPVPGSTTGATETISAISGPAENYTLPGIDDKKHGGLVAGLYAVTLSAPGYEPTTVQVQVAQGQVNPAAQVSLPPLGLITGTVTTHVGATAAPSCVISVPAGVAVPTTCSPTSATACSVPGSASARCSLTAKNGNYEIRGLVHGGYQVVVVPTDKEYLTTTPLAVQLELGGDYRYDAALDRLGRATVTVLQPDLQSLALSAAKGALIGMTDAKGIGRGNPLAGDSSANDGILTITGLLGTYTATAAGDIPTGLTSGATTLPGVAAVSTGPIGLNQTVAVTDVLTAPIGAIVGHVTVTVDGEIRPVVNTPVQVSGIVSFSGRTPVSGAVTINTDANGCYAIIPVGWANQHPLVSGDCSSPVAARSVGVVKNSDGSSASLIALPLGISVAGQIDPVTHNPSTQSYSATGVLIGFAGDISPIPPISLLAQPSTFPALSLDLKAPPGVAHDASSTTFTVVRKAAGSGNITIAVDADGHLTWTDSLVGQGRAVPGTYIVRAAQLGYVSATPPVGDITGMASGYATIYCELATPCRFGTRGVSATTWTMSMLPTISGTITAPGSNTLIALSKTTVSTTAAPPGAGTVTVGVADDGTITFRDPLLLAAQAAGLTGGLSQPTPSSNPYQFTVSLPGYVTKYLQLTCGATFVQGCDSFSTALTPLPRFAGRITAISSPGVGPQPLTGVSVSISAQPNPSSSLVIGIANPNASTSALTWVDPTQPVAPPATPPVFVVTPGSYVLTFAKAGFDPAIVNFTCPAPPANSVPITICDIGTVTLNMYPVGTGKVQVDQLLPPDPNKGGSTDVTWSQATVTINSAPAGTNGLKITVVPDPSDTTGTMGDLIWSYLPAQTYPGTTLPGAYTLTVNVPGYGSSTPTILNCTSAGTCGSTTISVMRLPVFTSNLQTVSTLSTIGPDDWADISANVTQQPIATSTINVTVSPTTGKVTWNDSTEPIGVIYPGTYTVAFSKTGYYAPPLTFTCATVCPSQDVTLNMYPRGAGLITVKNLLDGNPPIDWTTATAVLTTQPAGSSGVSLQLTSASSTSATLDWTDSNLPGTLAGITAPGTYVLKVSLPGYTPLSSAPFTCSATSATSTCGPTAFVLQPLPGVLGKVTVTPYTAAQAPSVTLDDAALTTAGITVSVDQQPNPSKGVSVTVVPGTPASTGSVSWNDPTQKLGVVSAGAYSLTFRKPGYVAVPVSFTCDGVTTCNIPDVNLKMDAVGSGTVVVDAAPVSGSIDWTTAQVAVTSMPAGTTAQVSVVGTSATTADLIWSDPTTTYGGLVQPTSYTVSMTLPGYSAKAAGSTYSVTCSAGQTSCGPTLLFTKHAEFTGAVTVKPDAATLPGAVLKVTSPTNVPQVTAQVAGAEVSGASSFAISWQEAGGAPLDLVSYGTYSMTLTAPGYLPTSYTWNCSTASCPQLSLTLSQASTLQVIVQSSTPGNADVNGGVYALTGTVNGTVVTSSTVNAPAGQNTASFPALTSQANYSVTIHEAGFATTTFNAASLTAVANCVDSGGVSHVGFAVWPGGNTLCTVFVAPLGTITTHVTGLSNGISAELASATVSVVQLVGGAATGPTFTGSTSLTGDLTVTGTTANEGLRAGTWRVTAHQPGYTDKNGTVDLVVVSGAYSMTNPTGGITLSTGAAPSLQIQLTVLPVELQVHLQLNNVDSLPAVTVSVAGPSTFTCTIQLTSAAGVSPATYKCSGATDKGDVSSGSYVDFTSVPPGVYTVTVSSATPAYQTYSQQIQVQTAVPIQYVTVPLNQRASTQSGVVLLQGVANTGITVTMRASQDIGVIAVDSNGAKLSVHPDAQGSYTFTGVPDGLYTVVAEFPGFAYASYPSTVTENSALTKTPTALSAFSLTNRGTRSVDVSVTSTAAVSAADGSAVNLAGSTITLTSTNSVAGFTDANQSMTLPAVAPYKVNFPQLPTGTWTATITGQDSAPFDGTFSTQTVLVPDATVSAAPPNVTAPLKVQQALATLKVTWNPSVIAAGTSACLAAPATSTTPLSLTITSGVTGVAPATVQATVTTTGGLSTAQAQVYLPTGSYSFQPSVADPMWTGTPASFAVAGPLSAGATSSPAASTIALVPVKVPVAVKMSVDGLGSKANGLTVTPTSNGTSGTAIQLDSNGLGSACLAPVKTWTFAVSAVGTAISVPSQPVAVVTSPNGSQNTVSFTADTVVPVISLQAVAHRVDNTQKAVDVTIKNTGGTAVYTEAVSVAPGTPASAPAVILGTCTGCTYTMSATPHAPGVFSAVSDQALDPANSTTFAATLPYNAAMVTVTVKHGVAATVGATVTVSPSTVTAALTAADGTTLFQDVPIAAAQTFTADWVDDSVPATPKHWVGASPATTLTAGQNPITIVQALKP
jgi:hypothetical protein